MTDVARRAHALAPSFAPYSGSAHSKSVITKRLSEAAFADFRLIRPGIRLADGMAVGFRSFVRAALMMVPLVSCAARIHAHVLDAPDMLTQDVNRCLSLVRVAASRRQPPANVAATRSSSFRHHL